MEKFSLKNQFILTLGSILVLSLLATVLTYLGVAGLFPYLEGNSLYPANRYERMIPAIEVQLRQRAAALLNPAEKSALDALIPLEGMDYQVLDGRANILYASSSQVFLARQDELYEKMNTTFSAQGRFVRVVPLITPAGEIVGAVALVYSLEPGFENQGVRLWLLPLLIGALLSPFIYIVVFTLLLARRFAVRVNHPLGLLTRAAQKIKEKDLDFQIDYQAANELGRLCAAFNEMRLALQEALFSQWKLEEERAEMVAALAHDLKTPLAIIHGYAEALLDDGYESPEKLAQALGIIRQNATRGATLVEQMQYSSDLEQLEIAIATEEIDLGVFMDQKVAHYRLLAAKNAAQVAYALHVEAGAGKVCHLDRDKLERILDNVVLNGLRYSPPGKTLMIDVNLTRQRIAFEINDAGQGFSKKDLANLFNRFYRGDAARGDADAHSGLGLYITRQLVEKMGGSIHASNRPDGGARVAFDVRCKN